MAVHIGLRSTGILVFGARIVSAFTGLLFTVMVARWLLPQQLGLWEVILTLVTFASYPIAVVSYWATRDVARGRMVGRTAIAMGALLSGGGLVIYYLLTIVSYSSLSASIIPFLLGSLLVPLSYLSVVTLSLVQGYRPAAYGYSLVTSEVAKVAVAYEALYVYHSGIEGVLIALMVAYFVQSVVGIYLVRGTTKERFELASVKRWSGLAWLPAVGQLAVVVGVADTYAASLGFGTAIVGYYQAAFIVASVVGYSSALATSLYPLLLRGGGERLPAITVDFSLLFSIPMAVGGVVLAEPIVFLLGSKYLPASLGLAVLSVMFLFTAISGIVDQTLLGTEKEDENRERSFRSLARSNLLFVPIVNIASAATYVVGMYVVLRYAFSDGIPTRETVALWACVQLATTVIFLSIKTARAVRIAKLWPGSNLAYYMVSGGAMGVVLYVLSGWILDRSAETIVYGGQLLGLVGIGAAVYFGLVYLLDPKFRQLAHSVLRYAAPAARNR